MKSNDIVKLELLLPIARDNNYTANELDILFVLLPVQVANPSYPIVQLLEEGKRLKKLGIDMLEALSAYEFNRPFHPTKMQQVEDLFQIQHHPNPEMKVVQRIDWLDKADYKLSVSRVGQLEVRRDVFVVRAIAFLGRMVVSNMIGIVHRYAQLAYSAVTQDAKVRAIFEAIGLGKDILNVSLPPCFPPPFLLTTLDF
jgi:hypothetical protein